MGSRSPLRLLWRAPVLATLLFVALAIVPALAFAAPASVTGTVTDADTGAPIAEADIYFWAYESEEGEEYYASSAADGAYSIDAMESGEYGVFAEARGYEWFDAEVIIAPGANTYEIKMTKIVPNVSGTVTADGAPVEDAGIVAYEYYKHDREWWDADYTYSDANGVWGMHLPTGVYRFGFEAEGYRRQFWSNAATVDTARNVTVWQNRSVTGINANLQPRQPSIVGTVTEEGTGLAVPHAWVIAVADAPEAELEDGWEVLGVARTDGAGDYALTDLPTGDYRIGVMPEGGYRSEWYDDEPDVESADPVTVAGTLVTGIDFELAPTELALSGIVTREGGAPVYDVLVQAFVEMEDGAFEEIAWAYTDESGVYNFFDLGDGTYRVGVTGRYPTVLEPEEEDGMATELWFMPSYWDGASSLQSATDIEVDGNQPITGYDLIVTDAPPTITGTVTRDETPVHGLDIYAYSWWPEEQEWFEDQWAATNADGTYAIYGTEGAVKVGTSGGWDIDEVTYGSAFWNDKATLSEADDIASAIGVTVSGIDLSVAPLPPLLTGSVVDVTGAPVPSGYALALQYQPEWGAWEPVGGGDIVDGGLQIMPWWVDYNRPVRVLIDGGSEYFIEYFNNKRTLESANDVTVSITAPVDLGTITLDPYKAVAKRLADDTRYTTAVHSAREFTRGWTDVKHIILASGEDRAAADPLAAAGLSWAYHGAPILLTPSNTVPSAVTAAVKEIVAKNGDVQIHVVGGTRSVPEARINQIRNGLGADAAKVSHDRIAGQSRYDNARLIALKMRELRPDMPGFALVANGADATKFFDALALSAVSANTGAPILLVSANEVPAPTSAAISALGVAPADIFVAGGARTVGPAVMSSLKISAANRIAGANRYATAVEVSRWGIENGWMSPDAVGVAAKLPDALTGGAMVGSLGGSLLVTAPGFLPDDSADYLFELAPSLMWAAPEPARVFVFGGTRSVSNSVIREIDSILAFDMGFN